MRHENARKLGYTNHAAFKLEAMMAESVEWVDTFLSELENELWNQGRKEMDFLMAKKREHQRDFPFPDNYLDSIPPWDYSYYCRLMKEDDASKGKNFLEYFPLNSVVSGLLATVESCLGLRFHRMTGKQMARTSWHDDVMGWAVWDTRAVTENGCLGFVGYLYMDLLSREGKYKGSQDVKLQSSFIDANGIRVFPATAIMCNFSRHADADVALLAQDDIVSLFHECGHAMHDLLSRTRYTKFHGWNSPPDFNEIPSMLFERWCSMDWTIQKMNCHYTALDPMYLKKWLERHPGQPSPSVQLSENEVELLSSSRYQRPVQWYLSRLFFSRFDMALHGGSSAQDFAELDPVKLYYNLQGKILLRPIVNQEDQGHPEANFSHLLKSHDAALYSYLSAQVIATNIFSKIFSDDPFCQEAWKTYREGILAWGNSRNGKELPQELLGGPGYILEGLADSLPTYDYK